MRKLFIVISVLFFLASCSSTKDIAYFQDVQHGKETEVEHRQIRLQPEDRITILVNTRHQDISNMLNLAYVSRQLGNTSGATQSQGVTGYILDKDGNIDFPTIGKIHVAGKTRSEVAELIKKNLHKKGTIKGEECVVTVEFSNLTYSVLGEVKTPNRYPIDRDAITIFDAISKAGDLTIHGKRTNVKVIRQEPNGKQKSYVVNLCSLDEVQNSPAFYIQQNDIVYVEPNDMRARQSTVNGNNVRSSSFWISLASLLTSVTLIFVK